MARLNLQLITVPNALDCSVSSNIVQVTVHYLMILFSPTSYTQYRSCKRACCVLLGTSLPTVRGEPNLFFSDLVAHTSIGVKTILVVVGAG